MKVCWAIILRLVSYGFETWSLTLWYGETAEGDGRGNRRLEKTT